MRPLLKFSHVDFRENPRPVADVSKFENICETFSQRKPITAADFGYLLFYCRYIAYRGDLEQIGSLNLFLTTLFQLYPKSDPGYARVTRLESQWRTHRLAAVDSRQSSNRGDHVAFQS